MTEDLDFLSYDGLSDHQKEQLKFLLSRQAKNPDVKFPWDCETPQNNQFSKGDGTFLNVHAPVFKSSLPTSSVLVNHEPAIVNNVAYYNNYQNSILVGDNNSVPPPPSGLHVSYQHSDFSNVDVSVGGPDGNGNCIINHRVAHNGAAFHTASTVELEPSANHYGGGATLSYSGHIINTQVPFPNTVANPSVFKLNPTVSSFVPQNSSVFDKQTSHGLLEKPVESTDANETISASLKDANTSQNQESKSNTAELPKGNQTLVNDSTITSVTNSAPSIAEHSSDIKDNSATSSDVPSSPLSDKLDFKDLEVKNEICENSSSIQQPASIVAQTVNVWKSPTPRTFADVLKSKNEHRTSHNVPPKVNIKETDKSVDSSVSSTNEVTKSSLEQDKMSIALGRHLYEVQLDFSPIYLQPRGLVNSRNWCYINATLQALLACSPFYTLLRNLPIGPAVDRGVSSTPVIDSMVRLVYEFVQASEPQEEIQPGSPFQPNPIYEMLGILKSDCLKGQQEDAEEFLSYILNGMHEEMVSVIKNYEKKYNLNPNEEVKSNGHTDMSEGEDEWQVIGTKQKGMVTRKVVEHKTPVSDLLGGQIKSFLTTSGNKTSASVQPFFTLQLDIQAESISSVEEALTQMTIKEPIQGYTCAKTKQEIEAYSRVTLQKLPPVLILHLKRFVYNKNGGCKKVMKHTEYPINLEFKKELFSSEAKKTKRPSSYTLFAVMYHDGEEAVKGHYISDIYHHGSKSWIRCDDRTITSITEAQVLSHSPPRVPYLLFYQVNNSMP